MSFTKLPELAPEPTPDEFAQIASAIAPGTEVISTRPLIGGISCRMDVLNFGTTSGPTRSVVVRQYGPWHKNADIHPRILESTVLELLGQNHILAPGLILDDEVTRILGRPAIVTSLIDGVPKLVASDLTDWAGQLVSAITKVHSLPVPESVRALIPSQYARFEKLFSRSEPPDKIAQHPLGSKLWQVLRSRWPSVDRSAQSLVHDDYWPGNTLWKEDMLVAIIDWEQPKLGEPTIDIATIVQDAACFDMDIEDAVIACHERLSGRPLRDFKFWRMMVAMGEMPDPGEWAEGFTALGGGNFTPDQIRSYHTHSIERMLDET